MTDDFTSENVNFDDGLGMECVEVSSEEEAKRIVKEMEAKGFRWAMSSTCGTPPGVCRMTFLPSAVFETIPLHDPTLASKITDMAKKFFSWDFVRKLKNESKTPK